MIYEFNESFRIAPKHTQQSVVENATFSKMRLLLANQAVPDSCPHTYAKCPKLFKYSRNSPQRNGSIEKP